MELHQWNSMENVPNLYGKYRWKNFHGNWFHYPPWNSMVIDVLILHEISWRIFHRTPWNFVEFHGGFSHGSLGEPIFFIAKIWLLARD